MWKEFQDEGVGEIAGFKLDARNVPTGRDALVSVVFTDIGDDFYVTFDKKTLEKGGTAVMIRLENAVNGLDKRLEVASGRLDTERSERERSEQRLGKPFDHTERLDQLRDRQKEINRKLLGSNASPPSDNSPAPESEESEFLHSAAMHDAAVMVRQMGGAAIVNGPSGVSIISDRGRSR